MRIPADDEIRALHDKHAPTPEAFDSVYTHCLIVAELADQLIARQPDLEVDRELVRAGALLHDIGVYLLYDARGKLDQKNYIRHGILGQDLLDGAGFPHRLCRFASHHVGMGLTRDDITRLGLPLPVDDYLAETAEEELVMYADKFHSKSSPPSFLTSGAYGRLVTRYGAKQAAAFGRMLAKYGEPDIESLAAIYGHRLETVGASRLPG
jgi:uncharacterized protein